MSQCSVEVMAEKKTNGGKLFLGAVSDFTITCPFDSASIQMIISPAIIARFQRFLYDCNSKRLIWTMNIWQYTTKYVFGHHHLIIVQIDAYLGCSHWTICNSRIFKTGAAQ